MQRSAKAYENGEFVGQITCEEYGHTLDSKRVWWMPETKKKYLYIDAEEFVSTGNDAGASAAGMPLGGASLVGGSPAGGSAAETASSCVSAADTPPEGDLQSGDSSADDPESAQTPSSASYFELYTGPVIHGGGFSF